MTKSLLHTLTVCVTLQFLAALDSWGCATDTATITNLFDAAGDTFQVTALSATGLLTGYYGNQHHAFLYNDGAITDLGTLGGAQSEGIAINGAGQVAGDSLLSDSSSHAFLYSGGQLLDLGTLGGTSSDPACINDVGQVVGSSSDADTSTRAFLYTGGVMENLGTLGGTYSSAFFINHFGVVCGESSVPSGDTHGFIYSAGRMTDVGTLGGTYSSCSALNDTGTAVGESWLANGATHAFSYSGGTITDLGTLGGTYSSASSINSAGQILGLASTTNDQEYHGFVFSGGVMSDVGTLGGTSSEGFAINNHGQVVGESATGTGATHAFLWQNGTITDLNELLPSNSGWELLSALLLNDNRRIVGFGLYLGAFQLFIMDLPNHPPVADPGADQSVECEGSVVLDGSHSSDPDGDTLDFQWSSSGTVLGTNSTFTGSFPLGTNVITLKVTDPCGLTAQSNVNVIVVDTTPPVVSCPKSLTAAADTDCRAAVPDVISQLVASDNCTPPSSLVITQDPAVGALMGLGTHEIAVTVTDLSGNTAGCTIPFTVVDATPPVIVSSPPSIQISADANCQAAVPDVLSQVVAADNCTPANQLVMSQAPAAGTALGIGQYTIVVTITDASGNASVANVSVAVVDITPPTILSSPASITVSVSTNCQGAVPDVLTNVLATDNCTAANRLILTQEPSAGTLLPRGPSIITVTVTDASGNSSSNAVLLTIADTTPPVITCPADKVLACGDSTDPANTGSATATDNCDQPVITFSDFSEDNCPTSPSHITRTWTATDSSSNFNSCVQNIYIQCCATGCSPISSAIKCDFNKTPISTTNYIWFNANFSAGGIAAAGTTVFFKNSVITITSPHGNFTYAVPDGTIVFDPNATCSTTTFNSSGWVTTVPIPADKEILLSALGIKAPANLQGASVTWSGYFSASTPGVSISWKWGAAVYTRDMTQAQYNALGVKPTTHGACLYSNPDHAGTPENMKSYVVAGARGGGGSNWTGSWSGTASAKLCK